MTFLSCCHVEDSGFDSPVVLGTDPEHSCLLLTVNVTLFRTARSHFKPFKQVRSQTRVNASRSSHNCWHWCPVRLTNSLVDEEEALVWSPCLLIVSWESTNVVKCWVINQSQMSVDCSSFLPCYSRVTVILGCRSSFWAVVAWWVKGVGVVAGSNPPTTKCHRGVRRAV